jgi:hypothetical protein
MREFWLGVKIFTVGFSSVLSWVFFFGAFALMFNGMYFLSAVAFFFMVSLHAFSRMLAGDIEREEKKDDDQYTTIFKFRN